MLLGALILQATPPPSPPPLVTPAPSPSPSAPATPLSTPAPAASPTALPAAGAIPESVALRVTGDPIDALWLQDQIRKAIGENTVLQAGVTLQVGAYTLPALMPGALAAIPVPVQLSGGTQYASVLGTVNVDLQDVAAAPFAPPLLFYDDDPEKLNGNGVIYRGTVNISSPARLYYYHENTAVPRRLFVVLSGASASSVQLIDSPAGPNIDVMSVGHQVTLGFLQAKPHNEGVVVDLPAGDTVAVDAFDLKPLDGAAGCVEINVLQGGPVQVTVLAAASATPGTPAADLPALLNQPPLPGDGHHRTGVFNLDSYGNEIIGYSAGGPDASVEYGGASPPAVSGSPGHDYGGYGVLRTLTFQIENALPQPQTAYLYERPLGGVVRSSFLVDGALVQLGCARLSARYEIGSPMTLPAGTSQVLVETMADGGSNYPLEVGMTSRAPIPQTPPIRSPQGCFPAS
jgi:hypothetical protein